MKFQFLAKTRCSHSGFFYTPDIQRLDFLRVFSYYFHRILEFFSEYLVFIHIFHLNLNANSLCPNNL